MCGIAALFCRESIPNFSVIDTMFRWAEKRGVDGTGYTILRRSSCGRYQNIAETKNSLPYSDCKEEIQINFPVLHIDDVVLLVCRAAPETEPATSAKNMQPIVNSGCALIHNGAVSQRLHDKAKSFSHYQFITDIDSETIISVYTGFGRDIKCAQEYLTGGFAYVMLDMYKGHLYVVNDFKPLATGYLRGLGYMVASDVGCLNEIIENFTDCPRTGINIWEYWYANPQKGPLIRGIDLDSGGEFHIKYRPRYVTNSWDSSKPTNGKEVCLVSCSGGLDSTLTLAILIEAGYENIRACHFKYGHRGQEAEQEAIQRVCDSLNVELKIFDLETIYDQITSKSMLLDPNAEIRTGTPIALKTTEAWVPGRNMTFLNMMAVYGESLVIEEGFETVYVLGGFLNLTESGTYPDNSEDFLRSFLQFVKYGTLCGDRFKPLYCLSNIMKSEQWLLIKHFALEDLIRHTISCDRPKLIDGVPHNCSKNGIPACGSGLLSYWGAKMAGMVDDRMFYDVDDPNYKPHIPDHLKDGKKQNLDIKNVINRILLPKDKLKTLLEI